MNKIILTAWLTASILIISPAPSSALHTPQPILSFPVISDIHIQAPELKTGQKFAAALQDLHTVSPAADALVINGDLTDGEPADYQKLKETLARNPHPPRIYYTIGNHEFFKAWHGKNRARASATFPNGETDRASIARFLSLTGEKSVYHAKVIKGHTFVFLGSEQYRQSNPSNLEDAYLSKKQLDWLEQTLTKAAQTRKPIFVFLHQPLPYTVSGTHTCCTNNRAVVQHEALRDILNRFPEAILFTGHTHWELKLPKTLVQENFTMVNTSSVVQPWTDNGQPGSGTPVKGEASEGLVVNVYTDRVEVKGRSFTRKSWIQEAQFIVPITR